MLSHLQSDIRSRAAELAQRFNSAQPFRHIVIEQFLDQQFCQELIAQFPPFEAGDARNEKGELAGKSVISDVTRLGGAYQRFDRLMRDADFLKWIGQVTGVSGLLYDPDYVGGGTHENRDGQELDSHVDFNFHPRFGWHRRLNLIVFLNPQWEEDWGGCLELLREPAAQGDAVRRVVPLANRAVIFETTESSWHGFRVIATPPGRGITRRSLAVYFYTHDRPTAEIAPPHGTYYYQRPLPAHLQAGYTLRGEDVMEIRKLFARRDDHIRYLYHREQEFTEVLEGIRKWRAFQLAQALTWPLRAIKKAGSALR